MEVASPIGEEGANDGEGFLEAADPMVEREAVGRVFRLVPAGAEAQDQPTAADLVEGGGLLGEHGGVVEAGRGDQRPDLHPFGDRGDRREGGPRLPWPPRRLVVTAIQEMVADPDRVEPDLLGGARHLAQLRPARHPLDLGQLDADLHQATRLRFLLT